MARHRASGLGQTALAAALVLTVGMADAIFLSDEAAAQDRRSVRRGRVQTSSRAIEREQAKRDQVKVAKKEAPAIKPGAVASTPPEPLVAVISIASQRLQVHTSSGVLAETRVSTGQAGHRTPTGVFSVLQRNRHHHSNIYSGAPMPYMQRLTWSGIALHEGVVPNYPASHGCIRMPAGFASRMWEIGRVGMRVVISPTDTAPTAISHPRLPAPQMTAVALNELPAPVQLAAAGAAPGDTDQKRLLDPYRFAHARKIKAQAERATAEQSVRPAMQLAAERSAEATQAAEELRKAERVAAVAAARVAQVRASAAAGPVGDKAGDAVSPAVSGQAATVPSPEVGEAETQAAAAQQALEAARAAEREKSDAAFAAAKAVRAAEAAIDATAQASREANAGTEPITIFVSRKEGRVFVRQGFVPLHEEPISISEPERPLGTHVLTAIEAKEEGAALRWIAVTVPSSPPEAAEPERSRKKGAKVAEAPPRAHLPASTATEALDRFELPEATLKLVGDRLFAGATLTISDFGISGETGKGTDFIVLTR